MLLFDLLLRNGYRSIGYVDMSNTEEKYQSTLDAALFGLTLERSTTRPLHGQLTDALREILSTMKGVSGLRLPSSRALAEELSVSRMTVTTAYDQLIAEGYLTTRKGAGTFVAEHLPHLVRPLPHVQKNDSLPTDWLPFQPGLPDQSLFPHRLWARHLERAWRNPGQDLLVKEDLFGWYPLREAVCAHLSAWRGLQCDPEQVIITAGAWEAFDIITDAVLAPGQNVAIEDPGWAATRYTFERAGLTTHPIRVDAEGLNPAEIPRGVLGVIITPSRHYPTGCSMPLPRRLELLSWADRNGAVIIEDDYDSEFRYQGQPLPALAGLDGLRRTLYMGSFSKLLSPALRIGYLVVPEKLIGPIHRHMSMTGSRASLVPQPALAAFMDSGEFATHLRRMRRIYAKRQAKLIEALQDAASLLVLRPDPSGMHLCVPLREKLSRKISDQVISAEGAKRKLSLRALSSHSVLPDPPQGLLLGYAAFDHETLDKAARSLCSLLWDA